MVVAPALAAAIGGSIAISQPATAATTWEGLRQCESGGDYTTNSGNGYYGAYQFSLGTWQSLGYPGLPSDASPSTQDEAALKLADRSGFGQWPVCGRGMGADQLAAGASSSGAGASGTGTTGPDAASATPSDAGSSGTGAAHAHAYGRNGAAWQGWQGWHTVSVDSPSASGDATPFTTDLVDQVRPDVWSWQNQMNNLGYPIQVDGQYGPESAGAASHLQASKGLPVDGICGPRTWVATFS
jgi:hypothetical protein